MIGNSFYELTAQYPDEASAERYFEQRRWPYGAKCPACQSNNVTRKAGEPKPDYIEPSAKGDANNGR